MEIQRVKIVTPTPHDGQKILIAEAKRFNVVCCGRRWGKSKFAGRLIARAGIQYPCGYFAPTYKLLEGAYKEVSAMLSPVTKRKHENQFIELNSGHTIDFWSLDNNHAGRSKKYKLVVVDEAAFVKNLWTSWTESIRPTLTDLKGDAWFFSTPKGKNDFFKLFMRGKSEAGWASWQMSTYTNPYIDPTEIDEAKKDLPEAAFNQEYLAQFTEDGSNPFGLQYIQRCVFPLSTMPPVCFGIDLAKSSDYTVIIGLDNAGNVCYFDRFQKDWEQTIQTILYLPNVPMNIDSTGVGDPIVEQIQRQRGNITGFKFSQWSKQQLMEGLSSAIQQRKISFPDGMIKDELDNFVFEYTRTGVKYSAPEGLHDDCVCALALAYQILGTAATSGSYSWA